MRFYEAKIILLASVLVVGLLNAPAQASTDTLFLPIGSVTPGSANPAVTQKNIYSTICVSGYTKTIRPSVSYTNALKIRQLSTTYSRYNDQNLKNFEEDHLIPLEIGGNPTDPRNLWPEPWWGTYGAKAKDKLENRLHKGICSGNTTLAEAQRTFAKDWISTYKVFYETFYVPPGTVHKSGGKCYVKPHTTKSGTHVKGYYRKC
jgi:hypothetical protein